MQMARIRIVIVAVLTALMVSSTSLVGVAQDAAAGPEGSDWQLTQYSVDGALVAVPDDVAATLLLEDGLASGSAGCNTFSGTYALDGQAISFGADVATTLKLCDGDAQAVEDAYLATLPEVTAWAISDGALSLSDAASVVRLVYGSSIEAAQPTDMEQVLAVLQRVQAQLAAMDARIAALEGGDAGTATGGGGTKNLKKPKAPKVKGKVQTAFPAWMRSAASPDSLSSDELNREVVTWKAGKGGRVDGVRIYARRGFCTLKPGVDAQEAINPDDFKTKTGKAVLIEELPAGTKQYRPDHAGIDAALPAAPASPYSNDQYYDLQVATYNAKGESKKTTVASFFLTPEFLCP